MTVPPDYGCSYNIAIHLVTSREKLTFFNFFFDFPFTHTAVVSPASLPINVSSLKRRGYGVFLQASRCRFENVQWQNLDIKPESPILACARVLNHFSIIRKTAIICVIEQIFNRGNPGLTGHWSEKTLKICVFSRFFPDSSLTLPA